MTKKEGQKFEQQYLNSKLDLNIKMDDLFNKYLEYLNTHKNGKSVLDITSRYNNHFSLLGKKKVVNIKDSDLDLIVKKLQKDGYHPSYINTLITTFKTLMNFALKKGYIHHNPVSNYQKIKSIKTDEDLKYWTPEEIQKVIHSIPEVYKYADYVQISQLIRFGFFTGMRYGEIRALKWKDIDFNQGVININRHVAKHNTERIGRKNGSYHQLVMDVDTRNVLSEIKSKVEKQPGFDKDCYVFHSSKRGMHFPLASSSGNKYMMKLAEANDLNHITFHGLRHSHASYLISIVGLSEAEVADRLGDTVAVTSKIYARFFNQARVNAANKISEHKLGF